MKELIMKYKAIILYLFFGGCTMVINIVTYYISAYMFNLSTVISTFIAWFIAVVIAYVTNKIWVFECKSWEAKILLRELISFFTCRILTGILDVAIMFICVDILFYNDVVIKIFSNILVIILNYVASKLVVFKKNN